MRKTAVLLTAALVLALAAPMVSAAPVDVTGTVESRFEYKQNDADEWVLSGKTGIELSPSLQVGDRVKLGIELETEPSSFDADGSPAGDFTGAHGAMSPVLSKVWLQTTGAFWQDGPEVTTTIGDYTINWNDWVGRLGSKRTVAVEGIDLMVADADVFYAWDGDHNPMGLRVASEFQGIDLDAMVLYRGGALNAALGAGTSLNGIDVDGVVAMDEDYRYAFKVNAAMSPMEDVTLKAGYRQMQDGFNPMYARRSGDNIVPFHKDSRESGFNIGVETVHQGFVLGAAYDQPTETATLSAARTFEFEGHAIDTKYEATLVRGQQLRHELSASTTTDMIPYMPGVGLRAKLMAEGTDIDYEVGTSYTAPNGISLGADYSSVEGARIHGGLKVSF
ncbi:MAG: hypothetical protein FWJ61_02035 [Limnochordales bacterium]